MKNRRRKSSFYYIAESYKVVNVRKWAYTIGLFAFSFFAILIMLFSSSLNQYFSDELIEKRFGQCQTCKCQKGNNSKLAIILPFKKKEIPKVISFLNKMKNQTKPPQSKENVELFLVLISSEENSQKILSNFEKQYNYSTLTSFFYKVSLIYPFPDVLEEEELLKSMIENPPLFLEDFCFFQLLTLKFHFLKRKWIDSLVNHSISSYDPTFWIKGGIDFSFHPFKVYEDIEITMNSLYASHCDCLRDLFLFADEVNPSSWKLTKSLTSFMRNPAQITLSHLISQRILPASFEVNMGESKISVRDLKKRFVDTYLAEGENIFEKN